jgi:hypothetical protein
MARLSAAGTSASCKSPRCIIADSRLDLAFAAIH